MPNLLNRELSQAELFLFFIIALAVFVFPVIQSDYPNYDDRARALVFPENNWTPEGRVLTEILVNALSFTSKTPNFFPFSYVFALPAAALALRTLVKHYYARCQLSDCLVVLPLFYSPFLLGILTYQYDGPAFMIGLSAVILSVTYDSPTSGKKILVPPVMLAIGLAFHQLTFNILLGLLCIEMAEYISRGFSFRAMTQWLVKRVVHIILALLIYGVTVYPLMSEERTAFLAFDSQWAGTVATRLCVVYDRVALLVTSGNRWLCVGVLTGAVIGYVWTLLCILNCKNSLKEKVALGIAYCVSMPLLLLTIPGFTLLLDYFDPAARVLLGLGPVLVGLLLFAHKFLKLLAPWTTIILMIPVLCMLSFSYMYGRVLVTQKALEDSVLHSLAYDINSRPELRKLDVIYLVQPQNSARWLPASAGVLEEIPALGYILNKTRILAVAHFPSVGVENVRHGQWAVFPSPAGKQQVVENRYYDIHVLDHNGYIYMKNIIGVEH
ncbi:hypothetical protein [Pseudomonas sp. ICMP 561]|uniref:hypothetical protein n=1 Tax=Pseudomonas sp. ICMP 561 TaxID=1718918 RepID=UPI001145F8EC|nr:hypothetical protein [Pseudomonas sp. ICMP 561]